GSVNRMEASGRRNRCLVSHDSMGRLSVSTGDAPRIGAVGVLGLDRAVLAMHDELRARAAFPKVVADPLAFLERLVLGVERLRDLAALLELPAIVGVLVDEVIDG